ncbi:hypothetical protein EXIGLDRAFT_106763 [Exidia glandulosa HHB12029]|uniref:Fungal N-terminal domain-containing protein n=1 Tax=Exidia glandulosa HHB12029 TaxID=1314781 RepID=A0A165GSN6_EXIGL|nr:hypothetical protein EXIGLDRAFT_106763 [Exidia glandulosa HHB12029]
MTVVAFSIGSFGDIIAVLQLAWDIRKSLSEASEYSDEINALIGDIDSFTHVLQTTKERLTNATNVPPSLHRGLSHALKNCRVVLERVQNKIRQHRRDNDGKYGARVYKALWAVCAWNVLGGKADVEALKRRLAEQLAVIDTLLSVLNSSALEAIDRRAQADGLVLTRILACVESFPSLIKYDVTDVPFRFFNAEGEALQPFRNLAWPVRCLSILSRPSRDNPFCSTSKYSSRR